MAGNKTTIFRSCGQNGQHRLPNTALYGRVEGKRVKGRPSKRWLDNVTDDCYHRRWSIVEATRLANDRQRWRTYIRLPQRAPYFMDVGRKFTSFFAECGGRNRSRSHVFPILDLLTYSRDIRDQSPKFCKIDPNFTEGKILLGEGPKFLDLH